MSHHFPYRLATLLSLIFLYCDVLVANCTAITRHLQLFVDLEHDQLQPCKEIFVDQMLLELFEHLLFNLSLDFPRLLF